MILCACFGEGAFGQRIWVARRLLAEERAPLLFPMFAVSENDAAAIRAAFHEGGEFLAAVKLRRRFPGIADNAQARLCARAIAGWSPDPLPPLPAPRSQPKKP